MPRRLRPGFQTPLRRPRRWRCGAPSRTTPGTPDPPDPREPVCRIPRFLSPVTSSQTSLAARSCAIPTVTPWFEGRIDPIPGQPISVSWASSTTRVGSCGSDPGSFIPRCPLDPSPRTARSMPSLAMASIRTHSASRSGGVDVYPVKPAHLDVVDQLAAQHRLASPGVTDGEPDELVEEKHLGVGQRCATGHQRLIHRCGGMPGCQAHPQARVRPETICQLLGDTLRPSRGGEHLESKRHPPATIRSTKSPLAGSLRISLRLPSGRVSSLMTMCPS